jgi:monoamine oxidase
MQPIKSDDTSTKSRHHDVVVVGAGFAGLMAARRLVEQGTDAVVIEASDRVGGRVRNVDIGPGGMQEIGGEWLAVDHAAMRALVTELGLDLFKSHHVGRHSYIGPDGMLRTHTDDAPPEADGGSSPLADAMARFDAVVSQVDVDAPWASPIAAELDRISLEHWLCESIADDDSRTALRMMIGSFLATSTSSVSMLHAAFMTTSGGGGIGQLWAPAMTLTDRVEGGSQAIANVMARDLGDRVFLNEPVRGCNVQADGTVLIETQHRQITASRVVLALPPAMLNRIQFSPVLPGWRTQLNQRVPMGSVVKCIAVYPTPFWRDAGLSGQGAAPHEIVTEVFDNSPSDGRVGALTTFITGELALRIGPMTPEERRDLVLAGFAKFFGPQALDATQFHECVWTDEPWVQGGYQGNPTIGTLSTLGAQIRSAIPPFHFAGTETSSHGYGHMEGAIRSGQRVADEILRGVALTSAARRAGT